MSHRWDCPTDYEAEREGRRAAERGMSRYSNPYTEHSFSPCEEAERTWERGYRNEQRQQELREEEEREEQRIAQRRREEAALEEAYWNQLEESYPEPDCPEPEGESDGTQNQADAE